MSLAARIGDMHTCPMVTGLVPHVGGPILPPCDPTVLIGYMPAARQGDMKAELQDLWRAILNSNEFIFNH